MEDRRSMASAAIFLLLPIFNYDRSDDRLNLRRALTCTSRGHEDFSGIPRALPARGSSDPSQAMPALAPASSLLRTQLRSKVICAMGAYDFEVLRLKNGYERI